MTSCARPTRTPILPLLTVLICAAAPTAAFGDWTPQALWGAWESERLVETPAPCLLHGELVDNLGDLVGRHPLGLRIEEAGRSVEDRPIYLMTLGSGPRTVFLWSQMHGDEPSATPALLDIADYLLSHGDDPDVAAILEGTTLLMMPMLNPDGAEVYERRNAQGIDINRDALNLATPEGRLLKRIRDQYEPILGFNLHDQNRRTAVGDSGLVAANAVLAVAGDEANTLTPGRERAKRACSAITTALAPFTPGRMARYDEDWSPRAFGDNITAWGTPVVLIESGGVPPDGDFTTLTRLNFVAILSVLRDLVRDDLAEHDPAIYEELPRNNSNSWTDIAVRGGRLLQPGGREPYRADLSFNIQRDDRLVAGCSTAARVSSQIVELGDNRFLGAGREIDASGKLILAPFSVRIEGREATSWFDAETLETLSRMGVGSVVWEVDEEARPAAEEHAGSLEGRGRAAVVVATPATEMPSILLTAPPAAPADGSLGALLAALGGEEWRSRIGEPPTPQSLKILWRGPGGGIIDGPPSSPGPEIRRGRPASFLLVGPLEDDLLALDSMSLESVWLDGAEVARQP